MFLPNINFLLNDLAFSSYATMLTFQLGQGENNMIEVTVCDIWEALRSFFWMSTASHATFEQGGCPWVKEKIESKKNGSYKNADIGAGEVTQQTWGLLLL